MAIYGSDSGSDTLITMYDTYGSGSGSATVVMSPMVVVCKIMSHYGNDTSSIVPLEPSEFI